VYAGAVYAIAVFFLCYQVFIANVLFDLLKVDADGNFQSFMAIYTFYVYEESPLQPIPCSMPLSVYSFYLGIAYLFVPKRQIFIKVSFKYYRKTISLKKDKCIV